MAGSAKKDRHVLDGCAPAPFSSYLKALGAFRVIARQKDGDVRGCWIRERFVLETSLTREDMVGFLLGEYVPSPVVGPWSYNKYRKTLISLGFLTESPRFDKYWNRRKPPLQQVQQVTESPRLVPYRDTVDAIERTVREYCAIRGIKPDEVDEVDKSIKDKATKPLFLRMCRNTLPDAAVSWLDTVFVLAGDGVRFAPVLGTGGNDGNFDVPENFAKSLASMLAGGADRSRSLLESALFGAATRLVPGPTFGHNPDGTGGPNFGMGFDGKSLSNPWEYILMVEGSILFAGSIARRQSTNTDKAIFPFTTNAANVGYATASEGEDGHGEIWLPVWSAPASYREIRHVFNEGRVQLNGRQAKTGVEFARAIASYGTERGISEFQQFCILKRNGKNHLTTNAGRMAVSNEPATHLISEIDPWYNQVVQQSKKKRAPAALRRLVQNMDRAILQFCKYQKKPHMLDMLICIGRMSRYASDHDNVRLLDGLSDEWLTRSYDGTAEFRLAASVASIRPSKRVAAVRANLENVAPDKHGRWVRQRSVSCVWNELDDLPCNMAGVLQRRGIDAMINSEDTIPVRATIPARTDDIAAFLEGDLDTAKIGLLIPPLSLVRMGGGAYPWRDAPGGDDTPLPEAYTVIKMLYPPDAGEGIPFDMSVLNLLKAERTDHAYEKASRILHSHGHKPLRYSRRAGPARATTLSAKAQARLLASLLFPLSKYDMQRLAAQVIVKSDG